MFATMGSVKIRHYLGFTGIVLIQSHQATLAVASVKGQIELVAAVHGVAGPAAGHIGIDVLAAVLIQPAKPGQIIPLSGR